MESRHNIEVKAAYGVYAPEEDSYLMQEAVEKYAFGKVLDMGTGTGIQGITAAKKGCDVTFVDINPTAIQCARENAEKNGVEGKFMVSNLFGDVKGKFNTIIFNPPYLPDDGSAQSGVDLPTYGGREGRELIDKFLEGYRAHVEREHVVLLLESSLNRYEEDVKALSAEVVGRNKQHFEELVVLKFQ